MRVGAVTAAWLLVCLCLSRAAAQSVTSLATNSTLTNWQPQGLLTVCTAPWEPMVVCSNSTDPASWSGHDVELMRLAMEGLNIPYGSGYVWQCMRFSDMTNDLSAAGGNCSMAIAGITINIKRQELGIKFAYPYYKSSLGILVAASSESSGGWGFIHPFQSSLWLAIFVTVLIFPFFVVVIEFLSLKRRIDRSDWLPGLRESSVRTLWTLMAFDNFNVSALGTRVVVLCFGFMSLLLVSTYTANLAAFITVRRISSQITSITDLRGKAVASHGLYIEELRAKYGVAAIDVPFNTEEDFVKMADGVVDGTLTAAIDDEPAMAHTAGSYPGCKVAVLPDAIMPFDYGVAFRVNTTDLEVDAFSLQILLLQESGDLERLRENFISSASGSCPTTSKVNAGMASVGFMDLWGLWVIVAAGLLVGTLIMLAQRTQRRMRKSKGAWATPKAFPSTSMNFDRAVREDGKKKRRSSWRGGWRTSSGSARRGGIRGGEADANGAAAQQEQAKPGVGAQQLEALDSGDLEAAAGVLAAGTMAAAGASPAPNGTASHTVPDSPGGPGAESALHTVESIFSTAMASSAWKRAAAKGQ